MGRLGCIAWLLVLLAGASAHAEHLRLAGDVWPPFTDQRLADNGLAADLVSTALRRAGYSSEYVEVPWARVLHGLEQGDYDIIVAAWYSADRTRFGLFSEPYLVNRIRFLKRKGAAPQAYASLADLRPYSIAVVRGYSYAPAFDQEQGLTRVPVLEFGMGARMLAAGRVQLTLEDELVAQYHLNRELKEVQGAVEFLPGSLSESPLHILVRRSHPQHQKIVEDFNQAIEQMRADGTYQRIYQRHGL